MYLLYALHRSASKIQKFFWALKKNKGEKIEGLKLHLHGVIDGSNTVHRNNNLNTTTNNNDEKTTTVSQILFVIIQSKMKLILPSMQRSLKAEKLKISRSIVKNIRK